ncbi:hypothetical protein GCM10009098_01090 [Rheinheimera aquimaris]|uniref:DUF2971 domain-containing protein n=1 Tax=Rheinheimera aquimaris TaxID=412437 RepID=A0ABP3NAL0_9GAMM|nr:DUF2971 domain-containing protein [Rheinheimera aquimaris]MCB5212711.1 DUF2971 domain-containing protein [Rheinheimera aquimaris]
MKVYRFEKSIEKRFETIRCGKLWASSPSMFNDLYDCRIKIINDEVNFKIEAIKESFDFLYSNSDSSYVSHIARAALKEVLRIDERKNVGSTLRNLFSFLDLIEDLIVNNNSVVCFFSSLITNPLMWAHYGDNHTGFCVEYEVVENSNDLFKVNYTTELPAFSLEELIFCPNQIVRRVLTTKQFEWAYENEFRLIEPLKSGKGKIIDMPEFLIPKKVILGAKFQRGDHEKIPYWHANNMAKSLNVTLSKMVYHNHNFYEEEIVVRN